MTLSCIDLFAGAGGTSTGAVTAGLRVVAAVNHNAAAVEMHAANHRDTIHVCQDIATVDPTSMPPHEIMLASPSCVGHSPARGKEQAHHDAMRATADDVLRFAEANMPLACIVENIVPMMRWKRYRSWRMGWSDLGYRVSENIIDAADAGVPQNRERLFIVATRTKRPITVPQPSVPHVSARSCIDLDAGPWSDVAKLCENTRKRIAGGRAVHGEDFLVAYYTSVTGGRSLDRPIGTLTTVDRYALVRGDRMRMLTSREYQLLSSFPADYVVTGNHREQVRAWGNSVPPLLAAHVIRSVCAAL